MTKEIQRLKSQFPIDSKIIILSNEPSEGLDPNRLIMGIVTDYEDFGHSAFVIYKDTFSNEEYMTMSTPMPYSKELYNSLLKLDTWYDRWNIYSRGISPITKETAKRKEKYILTKS